MYNEAMPTVDRGMRRQGAAELMPYEPFSVFEIIKRFIHDDEVVKEINLSMSVLTMKIPHGS